MMGQSDSSKLYGFYHFTSFKTRKEKKKKKVQVHHDGRGPGSSRTGPEESRQCLTVCDSTFTQWSVKSFGQWTLQVNMILMSPLPLLRPTELCHSHHIAVLQSCLSTLHSHNTSLKPSITVCKIKKKKM